MISLSIFDFDLLDNSMMMSISHLQCQLLYIPTFTIHFENDIPQLLLFQIQFINDSIQME